MDGGGDWEEVEHGTPKREDWGKDGNDDTSWRPHHTGWSQPPYEHQHTTWQQAPPPPPLQDLWSKAYGKGWVEGSADGYAKGFREGYESGEKRKVTLIGNKKAESTDEWHDEWEDGSASGSQWSKRKKPNGKNKEAWKAFHEKYSAAKENAGEDIYMVKLGQSNYELYPEEVQEELRVNATAVADSGRSKSWLYDMTDGWLFHLRLFDNEELPEWEEKLNALLAKDDYELVGAQWDANKAKDDPPAVFEKGVQYRPIVIKKRT